MLLDTYAWIEILVDSDKGKAAAELVAESRPLTAAPTIAEITGWALRNGIDPSPILERVAMESTVIELTPEVAELAGRLHFEYRRHGARWGLVDAMIYATAISRGETLLTGDADFEKIPKCRVI